MAYRVIWVTLLTVFDAVSSIRRPRFQPPDGIVVEDGRHQGVQLLFDFYLKGVRTRKVAIRGELESISSADLRVHLDTLESVVLPLYELESEETTPGVELIACPVSDEDDDLPGGIAEVVRYVLVPRTLLRYNGPDDLRLHRDEFLWLENEFEMLAEVQDIDLRRRLIREILFDRAKGDSKLPRFADAAKAFGLHRPDLTRTQRRDLGMALELIGSEHDQITSFTELEEEIDENPDLNFGRSGEAVRRSLQRGLQRADVEYELRNWDSFVQALRTVAKKIEQVRDDGQQGGADDSSEDVNRS